MRDRTRPQDNLDLPTATLRLNHEARRSLDASRVKKFIGPLIGLLMEQKSMRVGILSWNSENLCREVGAILATAISQQLDQRCALIIAEGVRFNTEAREGYVEVLVPSVSTGDGATSEKAVQTTLDRSFPVQVFAGPALSEVMSTATAVPSVIQYTDTQILLMPERGLSRRALLQIESFALSYKAKWLAVITYSEEVSNG